MTPGAVMCDTNKDLLGKRETIQTNVWRVYQVLLEAACPTEYEMLTRVMEAQKQQLEDQMREHEKRLIDDFKEREKATRTEMNNLRRECKQLTETTHQQENEITKLTLDLASATTKLEEETQLRLFFENKLNSLYLTNMESESKAQLLGIKFDKLDLSHAELTKKHNADSKELMNLRIFKSHA